MAGLLSSPQGATDNLARKMLPGSSEHQSHAPCPSYVSILLDVVSLTSTEVGSWSRFHRRIPVSRKVELTYSNHGRGVGKGNMQRMSRKS